MNKTDAFGYEIEIGKVYIYVNIKKGESFILRAQAFLKSQVRFTILQETGKDSRIWNKKRRTVEHARGSVDLAYRAGKTKALNANCVIPHGKNVIKTDIIEEFDIDAYDKKFMKEWREKDGHRSY